MGNDSGIIAELAADHKRIQNLLEQVRRALPGSDERTSLVEQTSMCLVRHLMAERECLHPLLHRYVVDGEDWTDRLLAGDREIEKTLKSLEAVPPRSERYVELLLTLVTGVTRHVVELEQLIFPRLQARGPDAVLGDAGAEARHTKAVAPTRPRPMGPDTPTLTRLTASVRGPWDRLRDRVTRRGHH